MNMNKVNMRKVIASVYLMETGGRVHAAGRDPRLGNFLSGMETH